MSPGHSENTDREFHRRHQFQMRDIVGQQGHVLCQRIVPLDMGHQADTTRLLDHPQQLERIEAARLLKAVLCKPRHHAKIFVRLSLQIGRQQAECLTQEISLPYGRTTALDGCRQPLMRIQRHRIGPLECLAEIGRGAWTARWIICLKSAEERPERLQKM